MRKIIGNTFSITFAVLAVILCTASVFVSMTIMWFFNTWANVGMAELLFLIFHSPAEGVNMEYVHSFLSFVAPTTVLTLFLMIILVIVFYRRKITFYSVTAVFLVISLVVVGRHVNIAVEELEVQAFVENRTTPSDFITENYVDPRDVAITFPYEKRNLLYIFLESIEVTFADKESGGAFTDNLIPNLTRIARETEDFSGDSDQLNGFLSMPDTVWTMAGMFAQTAGLPLTIPIGRNEMDTQETFFPYLITMGKILEQAGYNQALMVGSDATFGGRRLYFTTHGNFTIYDIYHAEEVGWLPEDHERVFWGHEDHYLLENAKRALTYMATLDAPFNFTMLTVDTHRESGWVCEPNAFDMENNSNRELFEHQYDNVIRWSDQQVREFLEWVKVQDWFENTTVVLVGDHPTMQREWCRFDAMDPNFEQRVFATIMNAAVEVENPTWRRQFSNFDLFPTILASLGVEIEGNRLALGTNLFSSEETLLERYGVFRNVRELQRDSALMAQFAAGIDENTEALLIRRGYIRNPTIPHANIDVSFFDPETETFIIHLTEVEYQMGTTQQIRIPIWTCPEQGDLFWMEAEEYEEGSWILDVDAWKFLNPAGPHRIHIYHYNQHEERYVFARLTHNIDLDGSIRERQRPGYVGPTY